MMLIIRPHGDLMKHKYTITRTVESEHTWIRLYQDGDLVGTFSETLDGLKRAKQKILDLENPPVEEIICVQE